MDRPAPVAAPTCFYEHRPSTPLLRRATAELVGTFLLTDAVFGAIFATQHLFHDAPILGGLVAGAIAAGALIALIFALGGASGGHFNPLITFLQWVQGDRPLPCLVFYTIAQFAGGLLGIALCTYFYGHPAPGTVTPPLTLIAAASEFLATGGLMAVIFSCIRSGRVIEGPLAVGAWFIALAAAAPTSAFANPVILAGAFIFVSHGPGAVVTAMGYLILQIVAALAGYLFVTVIYPRADMSVAASPRP